MFQENPYAMVVMAMLLQEAQRGTEISQRWGPQWAERRNPLSRQGRRLLRCLGALLVTLGEKLQAHQPQAVPGESSGGI